MSLRATCYLTSGMCWICDQSITVWPLKLVTCLSAMTTETEKLRGISCACQNIFTQLCETYSVSRELCKAFSLKST